ncbi:MAG: hypothetical protein U0556_09890 [Dehalococcoidia bacterium]
MPERATVLQVSQIGVETTPGVGGTANKLLPSVLWEIGPDGQTNEYGGSGAKYDSQAILSKEWSTGKFSGPLDYEGWIYLASGIYAKVSPSGAGTAKTWTMTPANRARDTLATFAIEQGDDVRAHRALSTYINSLKVGWSRAEAKVEGTSIGQPIADGITLATPVTAIAQKPVSPADVEFWLDSTSGGLGTTKLLRVMAAEFEVGDRIGQSWPGNKAVSGFAAGFELKPKVALKLSMQADAQGMAFLDHARSRGLTKFLRWKFTGDLITGSDYYSIQFDFAVQVLKLPAFKNGDGTYDVDVELKVVHDETWGKAFVVTTVNTIATL